MLPCKNTQGKIIQEPHHYNLLKLVETLTKKRQKAKAKSCNPSTKATDFPTNQCMTCTDKAYSLPVELQNRKEDHKIKNRDGNGNGKGKRKCTQPEIEQKPKVGLESQGRLIHHNIANVQTKETY